MAAIVANAVANFQIVEPTIGPAIVATGPPMDERRREVRSRTLYSGKIVFNDRRSVIDCIVRNLSEAGACLQVDSTQGIPESFELVVDGEESSRRCRLAWLSDARAGIEFCQSDKLDGAMDAVLQSAQDDSARGIEI